MEGYASFFCRLVCEFEAAGLAVEFIGYVQGVFGLGLGWLGRSIDFVGRPGSLPSMGSHYQF